MSKNEQTLKRIREMLEKLEHAPKDNPGETLVNNAIREGLRHQEKAFLELMREERRKNG